MSPDKPAAQAKFKQKYDLPFTLLADEDKSAAEAYGVWKEKNKYTVTVKNKTPLVVLLQNLHHPSLRAKKYDESRNLWQARGQQGLALLFPHPG